MSRLTGIFKAKKYSPFSHKRQSRKDSKGPRSKSKPKKTKHKIADNQLEKLALTAIKEVMKIDK